ncbi:MAG: hypothetical protein AVDCRST_MAG40-225, partial [uncultured Gemmatimonadaceae bacterium]
GGAASGRGRPAGRAGSAGEGDAADR